MVADAVGFEPVSAFKFPANRENNREFCKIRPSATNLRSRTRANPMAYGEIPYAAEQGIFAKEQRICLHEQGRNMNRDIQRRHFGREIQLATEAIQSRRQVWPRDVRDKHSNCMQDRKQALS